MTTAPDRATEESPTLRGSIPPLRVWVKTYLIGIFMGSADAVPGVSGGTIALIAGIYERLITAITAFTPARLWQFVRALLPVDGGVAPQRALTVWEAFDTWFLLALVAGVATAIVAVTRIVHVASEDYPTLLFGLFFGLIAASAVILLRAIEIRSAFQWAAAAVGFVLALALSGEVTLLQGSGLLVVFVAGMVAVSAMILPGISGSLLLVILGQYTRMSTALSEFVDRLVGLASGGTVTDLAGPGSEVVTFVLGGLVGLFTVARGVRRALDRNRRATLAFLVALVVGALRAPVQRINADGGFTQETAVVFAGAAVVGAAIVLVLDWYAVDLDLDSV